MRCIDRPFICESCDYRFRDIDELRLHKQLRQGVCSSYNRDLHDIYIRKRPRSDTIEFDDSFSECDSDKIFEDSSLLGNQFKDEADEIKEEFNRSTSASAPSFNSFASSASFFAFSSSFSASDRLFFSRSSSESAPSFNLC